jgi:hypothetical protein
MVYLCCCTCCSPQVYFRQWMKNFEEWWTFGSGDHTAGACHACVVLTHYLSERQIGVLRDSGVPILCQVGKNLSRLFLYDRRGCR